MRLRYPYAGLRLFGGIRRKKQENTDICILRLNHASEVIIIEFLIRRYQLCRQQCMPLLRSLPRRR